MSTRNNHRIILYELSSERLWNSETVKTVWKSNDRWLSNQRITNSVASHRNHFECPIASQSQVNHVQRLLRALNILSVKEN